MQAKNSNQETRTKNGRKRTGKISGRGTKAKQAARAKTRKRRKIERFGASPSKLRATDSTISRFVKGQKLRSPQPLSERFTAVVISALSTARKEANKSRAPSRPAGPRFASSKPVRERVKARAAGLRYRYDLGPGVNVAPRGDWKDATGNLEAPQLGTGRAHARKLARQAAWSMR